MGWWDYVQRIAGQESQQEIARRLEMSPSSVNRWQSSAPKPESVRAFAVAYGRPVQEAFVAAGYMQADDVAAAMRAGGPTSPATSPMSTEETALRIWALEGLPQEIRRRLILELVERPASREGAGPRGGAPSNG